MDKVKKDLESIISGLKSVSKKLEKLAAETSTVKGAPKAKKSAKPKKAASKKSAAKKTKKAAPKKSAQGPTSLQVVMDLISSAKDGVNTATLEKETGFNTKKVQNVIFKLKKQGKITTKSKGIYIPA